MNIPGLLFIRLLACLTVISLAGCSHLDSRRQATTRANSLHMKFVWLPAGEFIAGSPVSDQERATNETQHAVQLTRPFWFGQTHVTRGQFAAFTQATGYRTLAEKQGWSQLGWNQTEKKWDRLDGGSWKNPGFPQTDAHPVVSVTWSDAIAFCDWLSQKEGRTYRLPTEAEWEYACRAGTSTTYPWGDSPAAGSGWANCNGRESTNLFPLFPGFPWADGFIYTSPVASFRPNAWGIYDLPGNTLQWCSDWFADYPAGTSIDPKGAPQGKEHILRGGAFLYGLKHCRSAFRGRNYPEFQNFYVGFRVVCDESPDGKITR